MAGPPVARHPQDAGRKAQGGCEEGALRSAAGCRAASGGGQRLHWARRLPQAPGGQRTGARLPLWTTAGPRGGPQARHGMV